MMGTIAKTELFKRRTIGAETISNDKLGLDVLILQQPPQQPQRGSRVAAFLDDHVDNLAFVIDRAPAIVETILSRCQRGEGGCFFRRRLAAILGPTFTVQARTGS